VTDLRDRGEGEVWQRLSVCAEEHLAWTLKIDWTKLSQISNTSYKKGFVILNIVQPPPPLFQPCWKNLFGNPANFWNNSLPSYISQINWSSYVKFPLHLKL
jgi:hypothetical protein